MTAQDIMIGDWVQLNGKPMQVSRIDLYSVNAKPAFCCGSPHIWSYNNKFEPIIITAEILDKNGFVSVGGEVYQWRNANYYIWYDIDKHILGIDQNDSTYFAENISTVLRITIINIHELQHALKLCGIKKEIKI